MMLRNFSNIQIYFITKVKKKLSQTELYIKLELRMKFQCTPKVTASLTSTKPKVENQIDETLKQNIPHSNYTHID